MARRRKNKISWEMIGIVAIVAIFLVLGLVWLASPSARGAVVPPDFSTLNAGAVDAAGADAAIPSGTTEDGRPYMGQADAPVTVYEFADFQCPHCRQYSLVDGLPIKEDYVKTGVVKLVWVNFPFLGDESQLAARAGFCANEQGRFWDMHDWLFANQSEIQNAGGFGRERLTDMAAGIGLDAEAFEQCMNDGAMGDKVEADRAYALELGVDSTPSFLVNEQLLKGPTVLTLRQAIDAAAQQ